MNFSITNSTVIGLDIITLTDNLNNTSVLIDASNGARLHGFIVDGFNLIDSFDSEEEMKRDFALSYKSAKMSPFACRIEDGRYVFNDKNYEFSQKFPDGSAIHGILFNRHFKVEESFVTESVACVKLSYEYTADEPGYPFKYRCEVTYSLSTGNSLTIETRIINLEDFEIPVQDGWHPYFTLGGSIDDCQLQVASSKKLVFTEKLIPNGEFTEEPQFLNSVSLKNIELDNSFLLEDVNHQNPVCVFSNPKTNRSLSIYALKNYPILQIYTPPHRKSMAIENISGAPNCFNNQMGLRLVKDSEVFSCRYVPQFP